MPYLNQEELDKLSARILPIEKGDGMTPETACVFQGINQFEPPQFGAYDYLITLKASGLLC